MNAGRNEFWDGLVGDRVSHDPPKSPLKRGTFKGRGDGSTLNLPVPPLKRGARGDRDLRHNPLK
jgi:hypothetical protein